MKRRPTKLAAAGASILAVSAMLLTACTGGDSGSPDSGDRWVPEDPAAVTGSVTHWTWGESQDQIDGFIEEFNKVYPNVEVTARSIGIDNYVTSLSAALASGEGPDTYNLEPGSMATQFGPLSEDLTPLFESVLGARWQDELSGPAVDELTIDGRRVGAPNLSTGSGTLVVNLGLLEELGIELPDNFDSVEQLVDFCSEVNDAGKACLAMGAKDAWISQDVFQSIANSVEPGAFSAAVAGERPWTDPALVEALTIWQSLFSNGVFQEGALGTAQYPDAANMWQAQDAVAIATGTWATVDYIGQTSIDQQAGAGVADPKPLRFTITRFPGIGGQPVDIFASVGSGTALNRDSENKEAAAVWLRWLSLDVDGGQKLSASGLVGVPALRGVVPAPEGVVYPDLAEPSIEFTSDGIVNATEVRQIPYPDLTTAIGTALQATAAGESPDDAAATLESVSANVARS